MRRVKSSEQINHDGELKGSFSIHTQALCVQGVRWHSAQRLRRTDLYCAIVTHGGRDRHQLVKPPHNQKVMYFISPSVTLTVHNQVCCKTAGSSSYVSFKPNQGGGSATFHTHMYSVTMCTCSTLCFLPLHCETWPHLLPDIPINSNHEDKGRSNHLRQI